MANLDTDDPGRHHLDRLADTMEFRPSTDHTPRVYPIAAFYRELNDERDWGHEPQRDVVVIAAAKLYQAARRKQQGDRSLLLALAQGGMDRLLQFQLWQGMNDRDFPGQYMRLQEKIKQLKQVAETTFELNGMNEEQRPMSLEVQYADQRQAFLFLEHIPKFQAYYPLNAIVMKIVLMVCVVLQRRYAAWSPAGYGFWQWLVPYRQDGATGGWERFQPLFDRIDNSVGSGRRARSWLTHWFDLIAIGGYREFGEAMLYQMTNNPAAMQPLPWLDPMPVDRPVPTYVPPMAPLLNPAPAQAPENWPNNVRLLWNDTVDSLRTADHMDLNTREQWDDVLKQIFNLMSSVFAPAWLKPAFQRAWNPEDYAFALRFLRDEDIDASRDALRITYELIYEMQRTQQSDTVRDGLSYWMDPAVLYNNRVLHGGRPGVGAAAVVGTEEDSPLEDSDDEAEEEATAQRLRNRIEAFDPRDIDPPPQNDDQLIAVRDEFLRVYDRNTADVNPGYVVQLLKRIPEKGNRYRGLGNFQMAANAAAVSYELQRYTLVRRIQALCRHLGIDVVRPENSNDFEPYADDDEGAQLPVPVVSPSPMSPEADIGPMPQAEGPFAPAALVRQRSSSAESGDDRRRRQRIEAAMRAKLQATVHRN